LIRAKQTGDNKQWKNVVKIFKAAVASGQLTKTKEKSTGTVAGATGRKAKAAAGAAAKTVTQKAPRSTVKKVSYQVLKKLLKQKKMQNLLKRKYKIMCKKLMLNHLKNSLKEILVIKIII
jgi:hypothetical protein